MGFMKIPNLYKDQTVMLFKTVWALEKIHGTSAWITYEGATDQDRLQFYPGGAKLDGFVALFNKEELLDQLKAKFGSKTVRLHGEHYGGKIMKMSRSYGKEHAFVIFDIKVDDSWLSFDKVQALGGSLGLDCVHGIQIPSTMEALDEQRDAFSVQAVKRDCGEECFREGIVIRPLVEFVTNNGVRVIAKHKGEAFRETRTKRSLIREDNPVLADALAIADEWVTPMRLTHVLDKLLPEGQEPSMAVTGDLIKAMIADIQLEAEGEIISSPEANRAIGRLTAKFLKERIASL